MEIRSNQSLKVKSSKPKRIPPLQRQILKRLEFRCFLLHPLPATVSLTGRAPGLRKEASSERTLPLFVGPLP